MNSAKKIMKNQGLRKESKAEKRKAAVSQKYKILVTIGIILIVILGAGVCYIQLRPREILTVTGKDSGGSSVTNTVYYTDAMYDIYNTELQYNSYASLYTQMYGSTFWEAEDVDGEGRTGSQAAKKEIMDTLKQREILCMEAEKANVSLTEEEKKTVSDNTAKAVENLTDKQKKMAGLDGDSIQQDLEKQQLADKYKNQVIAGLGIDEEALKKTVNKKDFRQYTLQYYSFDKKDGTGDDAKDKDEATLKKAESDMKALQEKAAKAKDFTKGIITDSNNDSKDDNTGISYGTKDLIETDDDFLDKKTRKKVKKMKNNEISDVIETDDAYYVIKMVNNDDPAAYNSECEQVVSDEKEKRFNEKYKGEIAPQYTTEVQSYWKGRVTIGHITSDDSTGK